MIEYADLILAFCDGASRGTKFVIDNYCTHKPANPYCQHLQIWGCLLHPLERRIMRYCKMLIG